jgi:hypothetical protein
MDLLVADDQPEDPGLLDVDGNPVFRAGERIPMGFDLSEGQMTKIDVLCRRLVCDRCGTVEQCLTVRSGTSSSTYADRPCGTAPVVDDRRLTGLCNQLHMSTSEYVSRVRHFRCRHFLIDNSRS